MISMSFLAFWAFSSSLTGFEESSVKSSWDKLDISGILPWFWSAARTCSSSFGFGSCDLFHRVALARSRFGSPKSLRCWELVHGEAHCWIWVLGYHRERRSNQSFDLRVQEEQSLTLARWCRVRQWCFADEIGAEWCLWYSVCIESELSRTGFGLAR